MHHLIKPARGSNKNRKRVARGNSAGGGTTAGRGTKGQQSRTGKGRNFGFEGGQVPLLMRQPKMGGFTRSRKVHHEVTAGAYDAAALRMHGLLSSKRPVKILGQGTLTKKFTLTVAATSSTAKKAIEKAGGSVTIAHD